MSVTAATAVAEREGPQLSAVRSEDDRFGRIVVEIVQLAADAANPDLIAPVGLILSRAGLIAAEGVTFGCDYGLNVRSIELARGYVHARSMSWLRLRGGRVHVTEAAPPASRELDEAAATLAAELFRLDRKTLQGQARPLLLAE